MSDTELRTELSDIADSLPTQTALQTADRLKSLRNRLLVQHARVVLNEVFPEYTEAIFVQYPDNPGMHFRRLAGPGQPTIDTQDQASIRQLGPDRIYQDTMSEASVLISELDDTMDTPALRSSSIEIAVGYEGAAAVEFIEYRLDLTQPIDLASTEVGIFRDKTERPLAPAEPVPAATTTWSRPADFEDYAADRASEIAEAGEITDVEEAFLSGSLWTALVAEGRIDLEQSED